ncbi:cytochrome P450 [Mangrovivirga sp. M17]|uniref:Cytochrome P450 n=1 Tax=Mangrovivirga halotolerans TaxID=2993936 RepID=A0ABT3RVB4_9BACT|nr:cytochrome P450 [Mangrovivirga halotolerans]MCX2745606.1 cytochrome P450 [Mangrovivirga halotolerans]
MEDIKGIPTVSPLRFYTNARRILENPLPFHHENFEELGDTFILNLGFGRKIVFTRDSALAEYALQKNQKNFKKSDIQTKEVAKYLGHGLLTSEGELWKKQRKLIQPTFNKKQLEGILYKIKDAILAELDKIEPGKPIDILPVFNDLAFQTVVKSLFSSAIGQPEINKLQNTTDSAQRMLAKELRQPYLNWYFKLSGKINEHLEMTKEAREILKKVIRERKQSKEKHEDLLDMLLDSRYEDGSEITEDQLIDEILVLFTAGYETSSNALTFTCELLAKNNQIQEKIIEEVRQAKNLAEDDLMVLYTKCPYSQKVIKEALRLYPPAYFLDRVNIEDDEFRGKSFPAGTNILISLYEIHRHKDNWTDPETFNPERFNESRTENYYPFGAGPRKCIGNNFAMYEMVITIAELVSRYQISEVKKEIQIQPLITLKPKNAILRFSPRK